MPSIVIGQLKSEGLGADHIRAIFNPDDKQDVKLAYDLLKDIWSLSSSALNSNPGTTEVSNILAKHLDWDQNPCRLKLPALTHESKEIPDSADHIKPGSWRGNVQLRDVSLQTSWKCGRKIAEENCGFIIPILRKLEDEGADMLSPSGTLLVNIPFNDDDIDILEEVPHNFTVPGTVSPSSISDVDMCIEVEDRFSEIVDSNISLKPIFTSQIMVDGKDMAKSRLLAQYSKDPLGRYIGSTSNITNALPHGDGDVLAVTDPIGTLLHTDNKFWLCIGEVSGLRFDGQPVESISIDMLVEDTVSVSYQVLGVRPSTSDDDPELKHDWRTYSMKEHSFSVPGRLMQVTNPTLSTIHEKMPFYLLEGSVLVALTASIFQSLTTSDLKHVPKLDPTRQYPYRESGGYACFVCETDCDIGDIGHLDTSECMRCSPPTTLDLTQGQRILEHMGAHILFDPDVVKSKGKGANGKVRINQQSSNGCMMKTRFSYNVAADSTASSPCSNVPISCPICPSSEPAVWKYFMKRHFEDRHGSQRIKDHSHLWHITPFENDEMRRIWRKGTVAHCTQINPSPDTPIILLNDDDTAEIQVNITKEQDGTNPTDCAKGGEMFDDDEETSYVLQQAAYSAAAMFELENSENETLVNPNVEDIPSTCGEHIQNSSEGNETASSSNQCEVAVSDDPISTSRKSVTTNINTNSVAIDKPDAPECRKRTHRKYEQNDCLCGTVVSSSVPDNLKVECKSIGCETQVFHHSCISNGPIPRNWTCDACKSNGQGSKGSKRARK
ncbi:hypothetical protein BDQ17DRAFT_1426738 [Cyathus striatus]|nr:hypothetical protein BDQ17DRAFT_1426738 [Cyathus striatus]